MTQWPQGFNDQRTGYTGYQSPMGGGASAVSSPDADAHNPYNHGQFNNSTSGFDPFTMFKTYREDAPYMNGNMGLFFNDGNNPFSNFPLFKGAFSAMNNGGNYSGGNYLRPPTAPWSQNGQQNSTYSGNNALLGMR
jgi:hypothetical protein